MIFTSVRHYFNENSTGGCTLVNGVRFCELQEDTARANGVKVEKKTCIPPGNYQVTTRISPRFGREMVVLFNYMSDEGAYMVRNGAYPFSYIYSHGGNTADNSEGCLLHAHNRIDRETIQGTAEESILDFVKEALAAGEPVTWQIVHDPENNYKLADADLFGR